MKILIIHPDSKRLGGIESYYMKLRNKFKVPVDFYTIGKRTTETKKLSFVVRLVKDYVKFVILLKKNKYEIIHVNPSLEPRSFLREGIFILLAKFQKIKTIVFFRGWVTSFENYLQKNCLWLFRVLYGQVDAFIVLSNGFVKTLESWGCSQPIHHDVTVVDDDDFKGFNIHKTIETRIKSDTWRILFLSRIIKDKGIYETITTFSILQNKYPNIELIIAGDGDELETVKKFVINMSISNVSFTGHVKGDEKTSLLKKSHILFFPTSHGEGLPNTITESMGFGLPIVTRTVGGIADFFIDGTHGFTTLSNQPSIFADYIEKLIRDRELYTNVSLANYSYAQTNFLASDAALRLQQIYQNVLLSQQC